MTAPIRRRQDASIETRIGSDTMVMRLSDGDFFELSATAAAIWDLIDGTRDRAALLAALHDRYGDAAGLDADTDAFLSELASAGLIEPPG